MANRKYPWNKSEGFAELRKLVKKALIAEVPFDVLEAGFRHLFEKWQKELPPHTTYTTFRNAGSRFMHVKDLWDPKLIEMAAWRRWDEARQQAFKNMVISGKRTIDILDDFPELKSIIGISNTIKNFFPRGVTVVRQAVKLSKGLMTQTVELRIAKLINEGILLKGVDALVEIINREFFGNEVKSKITKHKLLTHLDALVWTKERLALIKRFVSLGAKLDTLYEEFNFLPKNIVDGKAKRLRGKSVRDIQNAEFEAGIGRLLVQREIKQGFTTELKSHDLKNPFVISVKDPSNFSFFLINGAHFGLEYNRVLDENVVRNMIRAASKQNVDAIILTGGLMWMDLKKSMGSLTTHRALFSGLDFEPELISPEFRELAKEIRKTNPSNQVSFETLRERVLNVMGGWSKVTRHKNGSPIFDGKIYFCFGREEEEMIESAAHAEVLYITTVMRSNAMVERQAAEAVLVYLLKESGGKETAAISEQRQEVRQLSLIEKRMTQTNVSAEDQKRFVTLIRSLLISWYKKAIPNAEFIAQGTAVCSVNGKLIEIVQVSDYQPSEKGLDNYMKGSGQRSLDGTLPDFALIAGPYNLRTGWGVIERNIKGKELVTQALQLPVAIDRDYLFSAKPEVMRRGSPIERMIRDSRFEPGAVKLNHSSGVWSHEPFSISVFAKRIPKYESRPKPMEYIYIVLEGDAHTGSSSKLWIRDSKTGNHLPIEVAWTEMMMRGFVEQGKPLPFVSITNVGDQTQGHHFPTQQNRHPETASYGEIEVMQAKVFAEASSSTDPVRLRELLQQSAQLGLEQIRLRGEHWPNTQVDDFLRDSVEKRVEFFAKVLEQSHKHGIRIRGVAEAFNGISGREDTRDIGIINFVAGNHFGNTVENEVIESPIYRRYLIARLLGNTDSPFTQEELSRLIRAPLYGPVPIGYGLISAPGGYEYGFHVRHKPRKSSGQNADRLMREMSNAAERGDYARIFTERFWIEALGHIHFFNHAFGKNKLIVICASGSYADSYGDMTGFRRSNAGIIVLGLPTMGPASAPIRIIPFTSDFIAAYMKEPWKIEWNRVFANSLTSE